MTGSRVWGEEELTALALSGGIGDQAAADRFFRATQLGLWRYAMYVADASRAAELVWETRLRARRELAGFTGRIPATAWLLSMMREVAEETGPGDVLGDDREVFVLTDALGLSSEMVAHIVGDTPGSIAARAARGRGAVPVPGRAAYGWLPQFGLPGGMIEELVPEGTWSRLEPLLPAPPRRERHPGRIPTGNRAALAGSIFVLRTGIAWADLPREVAGCSGATCRRRFTHWKRMRVWPSVESLLPRARLGVDR